MADCPPNAIQRGPDGEVFIDETCIGCGNCQRNCPYGVIRMDKRPPKKPALLAWLLFGAGPGPGEPSYAWRKKNAERAPSRPSWRSSATCARASPAARPACAPARPGAAIRVAPEEFLSVAEARARTAS